METMLLTEDSYLTDIPQDVEKYGFCKTLLVRREVIHLKHIFTEIFVRRSFGIKPALDMLGWDLMDYMEYMTDKMRHIHHLDRAYSHDINRIVTARQSSFFPAVELYKGLRTTIALDFDGVITKNKFRDLYGLCIERGRVEVCSANPTVNEEWFIKKGLKLPDKINACKGKIQKIKRLLLLNQQNDVLFYVDNETEYLDIAWAFGIRTFHYDGNKIKYYTRKVK